MNGQGSLQDKVIIVTGAAQGIGAALVDQAISLGARVVAVDRNADGLAQLEGRHGSTVLAQTGDVCDPGFVLAAVTEAIDRFGVVETPMTCFLRSDDASDITGQFIAIDGRVHTSL